jgi:DNA invertase Pin-like site-specific DNA recombinase
MQELLAELAQVQPTYLVCRALDRLHRSRLEWELLCGRLARVGVVGIAQFPQLNGAPSLQRLENIYDQTLASMQAAFAELQKAELKVNLMNGRRERAHDRLPNGGHAPYGYEWHTRPDRRRAYRPQPEERAVYDRIIEWVLDGWGPAKIARALNDGGTPTRNAVTGWSATTVRRILASQAQLGMIRTWDGWVPGDAMEPIIDRDRWELAQAALATRKVEHGGSNTKRNALAGLLRCSACGKTLKAYTNRPRRRTNGAFAGERYSYKHYTCKIYNSGCASGYSISERRALRELAVLVDARIAATPEWMPVTQERPAVGELEQAVADLSKQRERAERDVERAYEAYVDVADDLREVAAATLNRRRNKLADVVVDLERAQRAYSGAQTARPAMVADLEDLRDLLNDWQSFDDDDKRAMLEHLIDHAVVLPPGGATRLSVVWRTPQLRSAAPEDASAG